MSLITEQIERLRELSKKDKLGLIPWNGYSEILNQAADTIEQLAAKARPKTGHWKAKSFHELFCDNCGFDFDIMRNDFIDNMNYCPNCGAKMVEPQETETWNGIHAQITAPKGTFERIFNEADDDSDI